MQRMEFNCKNGQSVWIEVDENFDYFTIVKNDLGTEVGRLEFRIIDDEYESYLKLCWAYMDLKDEQFKFQGIGRECLRLVKEVSGLPIVTSDHDGQQQNDGSHLTGDAPAFVERMRKEGLIEASHEADDHDH